MNVELVRIVCTDAFHEGQEVELHRFERSGDGWQEQIFTKAQGAHKLHRRAVAGVQLAGDVVDEPMMGEEPSGAATRLRYMLRCSGCGRSVPVRHERLVPVLHTLTAAGLGTLSLSALGATVS